MSRRYLLDSNICIHLLRGNASVRDAIQRVGWRNCCISELTVVELFYGAECSAQKERNIAEVEAFIEDVDVIPLNSHIREFCAQKAAMRKERCDDRRFRPLYSNGCKEFQMCACNRECQAHVSCGRGRDRKLG